MRGWWRRFPFAEPSPFLNAITTQKRRNGHTDNVRNVYTTSTIYGILERYCAAITGILQRPSTVRQYPYGLNSILRKEQGSRFIDRDRESKFPNFPNYYHNLLLVAYYTIKLNLDKTVIDRTLYHCYLFSSFS